MTVLASIFRNATGYVDRYFEQVAALREHLDVSLWIAEGDSVDGTYELLGSYMTPDCTLLKIDHGGRRFSSVDNPERWNQIATVWNTLLDKLPQDGPLILVEADLIWEPETMLGLLDMLQNPPCFAASPQSLKGDRFYDTWGYRTVTGEMFGSEPLDPNGPIQQLGSAGSCIVMRPEVYRDCRFGENDGIVGFGRDMLFKGYGHYLIPNLKVEHP